MLKNTREFHKVCSCGVDMEIVLEIKVPKSIETKLESVCSGMVEVKILLVRFR